ncbi:nucleotide exchange factor GrpE [Rhodonellum sp.]|uniref:nucleotide exchange factor GrpE n=1 Tax=Rhodonellum sp. TaxID=2231180 RepID=UPI00271992B7|nr:nucleotide exchange factor GrpE [Rhodonellum sp.]MDO9552046.1 nucleotide exchange factor GrpE [Rhodonellum sp.]
MNSENTAPEEKEVNKEEDVFTNDASATENDADVLSGEEKLMGEIQELKDKYLRLYSEFENYRRRTSKERIDLIKTASEDVIAEIIPVVDDFERAFKASEDEKDVEVVRNGNQLIFHKLVKVLEIKGLKVMEDLIGKPFDADKQEAITNVPAPSEELKGKVIDVIEKGYTLGDKVVRYAKVVIGA